MDNKQNYYCDLPERIKEVFAEIDNDTVTDLRKTDGEYYSMFREIGKLQADYPFIERVLEGEGTINLTADEHAALVQYISLQRDMEEIERRQIYFRGHTDGYTYLKRIGAI